MKKNLSLAGFSLVAMGLFMGSCVSKRKYMDAQASAAQRYTTDSTEWASRANTMQQNVSSLEQKNTTYQKQMDSFRTASENYQKRWDNLQSTYTQQNTGTEQLHQQIHTAIDQYVEANNVEARNGKIYISLPEKMLFASSNSTTLSSKGRQALDKLADVLAANENVEVDIVASAAYYNGGSTSTAGTSGRDADQSTSVSGTTGRDNDATAKETAANQRSQRTNNATANNNRTNDSAANNATDQSNANRNRAGDTSDNATANAARANVGDSAYPGSGSVTARSKTKQDPAQNARATTKSGTKNKTASSARTSKDDRSASFSSTPKSSKSKSKASTAPSWNVNVARSTAIVRELTQNGLPQARIILTGQGGKGITTNEWASNNRGYQIIVSPKMDSYYQMMQEGQGQAQGQGTTTMK